MASGLAPDRLNSRHYHIAALDAVGYTNVEIAEMLECNPNRIATVKGSPLYQALLQAERRKLSERTREDHVKRLESMTEKALDAKEYLLEQRENLSVLNAASDFILERKFPKKTETETKGEVVVKLTVEHEALIRKVMVEDAETLKRITAPGLTPLQDAMVDAVIVEEESVEAEV